jgi:hypothetical protein
MASIHLDRTADPHLGHLISKWTGRHGKLVASPIRRLQKDRDGIVVWFRREMMELRFSDGTMASLERANSSTEWSVLRDPDDDGKRPSTPDYDGLPSHHRADDSQERHQRRRQGRDA